MSTWKWRYDPEKCDHGICVGDCDICDRETFEDEEEEDDRSCRDDEKGN